MAVYKVCDIDKRLSLYCHITILAGNPKVVLPALFFNMFNGGSHDGNKLAMQEFMILPVGVSSLQKAIHIGADTYHNSKNIIKEKYGKDSTNVGD